MKVLCEKNDIRKRFCFPILIWIETEIIEQLKIPSSDLRSTVVSDSNFSCSGWFLQATSHFAR